MGDEALEQEVAGTAVADPAGTTQAAAPQAPAPAEPGSGAADDGGALNEALKTELGFVPGEAEKAEPGKAPGESGAGKPVVPPEVQEAVDRRIGEVVKKQKEAQEALERERQHTKDLQDRLTAVESAKAEGRAAALVSEGIHSLAVTGDERALVKRAGEVQIWREHCEKSEHLQNGYESKGEGDFPTMSPKQVAEALQTARAELGALARGHAFIAARREADRSLLEVYPTAAVATSALSQAIAKVMDQQPRLQLLPDGRKLAADIVVGRLTVEKARKARAAEPTQVGLESQPARRNPVTGAPRTKDVFTAYSESNFNKDTLKEVFDHL